MIGYPKHLNSRFDYEFVRKNFPKEAWEKDFQNLLDGEYAWMNIGELPKNDAGVTDDSHQVSEPDQDGRRYQYEKQKNPHCMMYQLGYTREEVEKILHGGENGAD